MRGRSPALVSLLTALGTALVAACSPEASAPPVVLIEAGPDAGPRLQGLLDTLRGPARVILLSGRYVLDPVSFTDPSCGNCRDPSETVPATRGLRLAGSGLSLEGSGADSVVVETRAGYGVYFDGCDGCVLRGMTITGGERDPDGRATDGGVVIRNGRVTLEDCSIRENLGDSAIVQSVVVGIGGVMVREGGDATVRGCRIERNSWDGVALYRGARARIEENVIDGVDAASSGRHGGGRGVGIGVTWDGEATIIGNFVTRYWKGVGVFVDARAEIRENVLSDLVAWGVSIWGPDGSAPTARVEGNAVLDTGACGVLVDREAPMTADDGPGLVAGNVFVGTGSDERFDGGEPYCPQRPVARMAVPDGFEIRDNIFFDVRQPGPGPTETLPDSRAAFLDAAGPVLDALAGHAPIRDSGVLERLGR